MKKIVFYTLVLTSFLFVHSQEIKYSINSGEVWLDTNGKQISAHGGGFLIHNNTYYWFGEDRTLLKKGEKISLGVRVYSSNNLNNWSNRGLALQVVNDTLSKLQKGCILERPKVIYNKKTKKFVMWFHHELKDQGYKSALTGVAIADSVTGPYEYIDSFRIHTGVLPKNLSLKEFDSIKPINENQKLNKKIRIAQAKRGEIFKRDFKKGQMSRDMTLFVDDDDTAYHITASEENQTLLISKLSDDYTALSNSYIRVFPGGRNEAPALFKKDGKYFMFSSGLTGWKPNPARLAVANSIFGKWEFLENPCRGNENERKTTFKSQSTYIIPLIGKKDAFIFAADRWNPNNISDSRYVWLPIKFEKGNPFLEWKSFWSISDF